MCPFVTPLVDLSFLNENHLTSIDLGLNRRRRCHRADSARNEIHDPIVARLARWDNIIPVRPIHYTRRAATSRFRRAPIEQFDWHYFRSILGRCHLGIGPSSRRYDLRTTLHSYRSSSGRRQPIDHDSSTCQL